MSIARTTGGQRLATERFIAAEISKAPPQSRLPGFPTFDLMSKPLVMDCMSTVASVPKQVSGTRSATIHFPISRGPA